MKREYLEKSLLIQERGLKLLWRWKILRGNTVAPYTGAWIEIRSQYPHRRSGLVAPYTGAWIEIQQQWS